MRGLLFAGLDELRSTDASGDKRHRRAWLGDGMVYVQMLATLRRSRSLKLLTTDVHSGFNANFAPAAPGISHGHVASPAERFVRSNLLHASIRAVANVGLLLGLVWALVWLHELLADASAVSTTPLIPRITSTGCYRLLPVIIITIIIVLLVVVPMLVSSYI
jgi:hypothetical protein